MINRRNNWTGKDKRAIDLYVNKLYKIYSDRFSKHEPNHNE